LGAYVTTAGKVMIAQRRAALAAMTLVHGIKRTSYSSCDAKQREDILLLPFDKPPQTSLTTTLQHEKLKQR